MADSALDGLTAASAVTTADLVYVEQGGTTDAKATVAQVLAATGTGALAAVAASGSASDLGTGTLPIARIAAAAVTYAKIQNISATDKLLGRSTAGAGVTEEIACTAAGRALIDDADATAQRTTLGLATVASSGSAADLSGTLPRGSLPMLPPISVTFDGGGSALVVGTKVYVTIPFACTIAGWYLAGDQSGSVVIDVWKVATGTALPTVSNTITASAKPTLSSAAAGNSTTLTGWTTSVAAGDILGFNVDSVTTLTKANLVIKLV